MPRTRNIPNRWSSVSWDVCQDPRLDFIAVGVYAYIRSLPEDAPISVERLAAVKRQGVQAVSRAVATLIDAGLYHRIRVRQGALWRTYVVCSAVPCSPEQAAVDCGIKGAEPSSEDDPPESGAEPVSDAETPGNPGEPPGQRVPGPPGSRTPGNRGGQVLKREKIKEINSFLSHDNDEKADQGQGPFPLAAAAVDLGTYEQDAEDVEEHPTARVTTVEAPPPAPPKRAPRATAAPAAIEITEAMRAWAAERAPLVTDLDAETEAMLDYHVAKGNAFRKWDAAWRTWMRNAQKYAERDSHRPATRAGGATDEDPGPGRLRDAHGTVWSGIVPNQPGWSWSAPGDAQ